jgi:hypothetical protein
VAPRVLKEWRDQAMTESPSHLRDHADDLKAALLAALLFCRRREITDALVTLLISTVHRIGARAERRVTTELVSAFKKVQGKEGLLFRVADAALARPNDPVRRVVSPSSGRTTCGTWSPSTGGLARSAGSRRHGRSRILAFTMLPGGLDPGAGSSMQPAAAPGASIRARAPA